jgi:hypothetical protein
VVLCRLEDDRRVPGGAYFKKHGLPTVVASLFNTIGRR